MLGYFWRMMGICESSFGMCESSETALRRRNSLKINTELNKKKDKNIQKLLLLGKFSERKEYCGIFVLLAVLGPGESGKSTLVKQMQIIHLDGFSEIEIDMRRGTIYSNIIRSMLTIINAMHKLNISIPRLIEVCKSFVFFALGYYFFDNLTILCCFLFLEFLNLLFSSKSCYWKNTSPMETNINHSTRG